MVVDEGHAGLFGGKGQGIGNQGVAAPGQHHGAHIVVGGAGKPRDFQPGADHAEVEGGVVGREDVAADERADLREQLPEAGPAGHLLGPDAVDADVVVVEGVVVFRRPHQPRGLLDDDAAADLGEANGARRTAEAVGGLEVDRRKVQTHGDNCSAGGGAEPVKYP